MKKLSENIFIKSYPKIDLHGFDRDMAEIAVLDFINESLIQKQFMIVIVHGNGEGIIRSTVWNLLKKHKKVLDYKSDYFNTGCTIVRLKDE